MTRDSDYCFNNAHAFQRDCKPGNHRCDGPCPECGQYIVFGRMKDHLIDKHAVRALFSPKVNDEILRARSWT